MVKLGVNREHQKKNNRGLVLRLVATGQCTSRVELARNTGLTKTAISQIVNELIAGDYLVETQKENTQELGRNPVGLGISPKAPLYAGVLVQRGYCEAVLCDMKLNVIRQEKEYQEADSAEEVMEMVYRLLDHVMEGQSNVRGIGAASIGPVSVREGKIMQPLYFNKVGNIELRRLLTERYGMPVYFDHDNQSAALAEQLFGNGRGYQDILLVSVGNGVGCGIVVGGDRVHSSTGYAPEIGHITVDYRGIPCVCGNNGCLERYINSWVMMEQFRTATGLDLEYREFCQMTEHPVVSRLMRETVRKLTSALVSTVNVLNSEIILLGMDCTCWPDQYIQMMEEEINQKKFGNRDVWIPVKKAKFMEKAQVMGAACNAISQVFHGELL
jgi:predicted NBD/HSP70 family sugar kinase